MENSQHHHPFWTPGARDAFWKHLSGHLQQWDVIVIGGGISGAGILRECTRRGLSALLLEKNDFSWGSSSKSSKMVHGGLRYLASGQFALTRDSVRERQRLMTEARGLVDPLQFLMGHYQGQFPPGFIFDRVLDIYDHMAGARQHQRYPAGEAQYLAPGIRNQGLKSISRFTDAVTDDSRLVLRVLHEALREGGQALNYCAVTEVVRTESHVSGQKGRACGVVLHDLLEDRKQEIPAKVVINATGAWADQLRVLEGEGARMRPLRGSHLVVPQWRFPVAFSVSFFHPRDKRPVFVFPWEGVTVIGTTDLDHQQDLNQDARITREEVDYLLAAMNHQFPGLRLLAEDVMCTWSGVRPVVSSGAADPSKEKREHSVWDDAGMITVAGGKLTTFRLIALDVLRHAQPYLETEDLSLKAGGDQGEAIFSYGMPQVKPSEALSLNMASRLGGRYGADAEAILEAPAADLRSIGNSRVLWAELDWCLRHETVIHLDDLMLRRTRLGLLLPHAGDKVLEEVGYRCRQVLGWSEQHWSRERSRYLALHRTYFGLPSEGDEQAPAEVAATVEAV